MKRRQFLRIGVGALFGGSAEGSKVTLMQEDLRKHEESLLKLAERVAEGEDAGFVIIFDPYAKFNKMLGVRAQNVVGKNCFDWKAINAGAAGGALLASNKPAKTHYGESFANKILGVFSRKKVNRRELFRSAAGATLLTRGLFSSEKNARKEFSKHEKLSQAEVAAIHSLRKRGFSVGTASDIQTLSSVVSSFMSYGAHKKFPPIVIALNDAVNEKNEGVHVFCEPIDSKFAAGLEKLLKESELPFHLITFNHGQEKKVAERLWKSPESWERQQILPVLGGNNSVSESAHLFYETLLDYAVKHAKTRETAFEEALPELKQPPRKKTMNASTKTA